MISYKKRPGHFGCEGSPVRSVTGIFLITKGFTDNNNRKQKRLKAKTPKLLNS
jgi:hypothetical protein